MQNKKPPIHPPIGRRRFLKMTGLGAAVVAVDACVKPPGQMSDDGGIPLDGALEPDAGGGRWTIPGITDNEEFYVTSSQGTPEVDGTTWQLQVDGAVSQPATLTLADLDTLGAIDKEHTLCCIGSSPGSPAIGNALWSGRPLSEVLDFLGVTVQTDAVEMQFEGADTYRTSIPITDLTDRELWLVWRMNGEPLPPSHGYPVRVLTPGRYGTKNPKWLTRLTFGTEAELGYWESRGWSNDAIYRTICYFLTPERGATVPRGTVRVQGAAFAGSSAVSRVEVSADGGDTWEAARFTYQGPADTWTLWEHELEAASAGNLELLARVEAADGRETNPDWQQDYGGYDGYGTLPLTIT